MNKWIWMLILTTPILMQAQEKNPHINGWIRSGNAALERGDSTEALLLYDRVLAESPNDDRARFNKAIALAKPEKTEEAMTLYQVIAESNENEIMQADAWYNMGNLAFRQQEFDKAVEYYKNALRLQPNDQDAKHNYYLAKNMQQQQQEQQQQQNQQGDQNQDQKDQNQDNQQQQQDQQDQQNQGDQNQNSDQEQQQDQEQEGNQEQDSKSGEEEQEQQQGGQPGEEQEQQEGQEQQVPVARLSKEETERLLEALENQEKQLQGKLLEQKPKKKGRKPEKDW